MKASNQADRHKGSKRGKPAGRKGEGAAKGRKAAGQPFIVLTGLSGSGKSQAIRALEDLGYFCVDNLPTTLIPTLAKLSLRAGGDIEKVQSSSTCGKANSCRRSRPSSNSCGRCRGSIRC